VARAASSCNAFAIATFSSACAVQIVYCSDVDSLRDLWAMCDRINVALRSVLLPRRHPSTIALLVEFGLRRALTRVSISGPQLLHYKQNLVELREQKSI